MEEKQIQQDTVLSVKDLYVDFVTEDEVVHAVNGLNIELGREKTLGLVGETGAGKTTTAKAIMNLVPSPPGVIRSGSIILDGKDVLKMTPKELEGMRGKDVAMIFQDPMTALNPVYTVGEQIAETLSVPVGTVRSRLHRARAALREALERAGVNA